MPAPLPPFGRHGPVIFASLRRAVPSFSAAAFAAHLGVARGLVSEWERGHRSIPFGVVVELAAYAEMFRPGVAADIYRDALARFDLEAQAIDSTEEVSAPTVLRSASMLTAELAAALHPDSHGGHEVTDAELSELLDEAEQCKRDLDALVNRLARRYRRGA